MIKYWRRTDKITGSDSAFSILRRDWRMRFAEDGPCIPNELLLARDQGRVVFFCGAGVSRAKAGLPDFFGLAESVARTLGVSDDSAAIRILNTARDIDAQTGVTGLISADRIFGLLERDFRQRDIEEAVATALKPKAVAPDLTAHNTLLDLATTQEGFVRLVTTNFDRLFEDCGRNLPAHRPPRLPDPARLVEMHGIVYLHGTVSPDYRGALGDGFVLSSSEFGRAYLSDGWATAFFRNIIEKFVVVFVGYAADDPPVYYLLEALRKTSGSLDNVYAFQSGDTKDASARWVHKGVQAIAYEAADDHGALWRTLEAWARRAKDPERWVSEIIDRAMEGPDKLLAYERGQVAHVVATLTGARKFAERPRPPPAEWLCVFDPYRRFAKPGSMMDLQTHDRGPLVDPFEMYGIDSDARPAKIDPEDHFSQREVPKDAWNAFALARLDRVSLVDDHLSAVRGYYASNVPALPPRLQALGAWIAKVSGEPAAVWWAVHQKGLHPSIRTQIQWSFGSQQISMEAPVRKAWRYLFEHWDQSVDESRRDWHELSQEIAQDGWSYWALRRFAECHRPRLKVDPPFGSGPRPPSATDDLTLGNLISADVMYAEDLGGEIVLPEAWLPAITVELRKNLEIAVALEDELGGHGLYNLVSIAPNDNNSSDLNYSRSHGLTGAIVHFAKTFQRLVEANVASAKAELGRWPNDDSVFALLRAWAAGNAILVEGRELGSVLASLSDAAFWSGYHARDLLLTLSARWKDLDFATRDVIERRIQKGPIRWKQEDEHSFEERKASQILDRIAWLSSNGCDLKLDVPKTIASLRLSAPNWKPEHAAKAAESLDTEGGWVQTDTAYTSLLNIPIGSVLAKAIELSGRTDDFLVERAPFAGLSEHRPKRAFAALRLAAKKGDFPDWAWRAFLNCEARKTDDRRLVLLIAEQLTRIPDESLLRVLFPAAVWLLVTGKELAASYPRSFDSIVDGLTSLLGHDTAAGASSVGRRARGREWATEALNAPAGYIAQALLIDPRLDALGADVALPKDWSKRACNLLTLAGDVRRHALVFFAHRLNWFYSVDSAWTKTNLLSVLVLDDASDKRAFWSGFLWSAQIPSAPLFLHLKPYMLQLAIEHTVDTHSERGVLASMLLAGWGSRIEGTNDRYISDDEFRNALIHADEEFRSRVLWQVSAWTGKAKQGRNDWRVLTLDLLRDVWPRHISAKSSRVSARLCDLAFSDIAQFPQLVQLVIPLVAKVESEHLSLPMLRSNKYTVVDKYPRETLELLSLVLPDKVFMWPYGIDEVLQRLSDSPKMSRSDGRLLELKRKWDSR